MVKRIVRRIPSILIAVVAFSQWFLGARAAAPEPLVKAREALADGRLEDADRWFALALRDFPKAPEAPEAVFQVAALATARELTQAKLLKLWKEGSRLERVENGDSKMNLEVQYYEDEARKSAAALLDVAKAACAAQPAFASGVDAPKLDAESDAVQARVRKGEWVGAPDRKKLEAAEWKLNYAGVLKEAFPAFAENERALRADGPVRWEALAFALGTRLMIAQDFYRKLALAPGARRCFERALALTADNPYSDLHQRAKESLAKLR